MQLPVCVAVMAVLLLGSGISCNESSDFTNTEFNKTTGLFFEKLTILQNIEASWRVTFLLGNLEDRDTYFKFQNAIDKLLSQCMDKSQDYCKEKINYHRLQKRREVAKKMKDKLSTALADLKKSPKPTKEEEEGNPKNFRTSRQTVSMKLLGKSKVKIMERIFDLESEEKTEPEVPERLRNVTINSSGRNHFIEAQLGFMENLETKVSQQLKKIEESMSSNSNYSSADLREIIRSQHILWTLKQASLDLEFSMEEYANTMETMISVVYAIQEGKIHPHLFKQSELIEIFQEILKLSKDLESPLDLCSANLFDLMRISTMFFKTDNDNINITLDIPILGKTKYQLYKLHGVHISQKIVNNGTGRAYIMPRTKYLAVDLQKQYYFYMRENILRNCVMIGGRYICNSAKAYYNAKKVQSCEVDLLEDSKVETLRTCNIRVSFKREPFWTAVVTLGGWLYSLPEPVKATMKCTNRDGHVDIHLKNTGLLQIAPGCILETESVTLPSLVVKEIHEEYIYEASIHLNFSIISPILFNYYKLNHNAVLICPYNETECSLKELEDLEKPSASCSCLYDSLTITNFWGLISLAIILLVHIIKSYIILFYNYMYNRGGRRVTHAPIIDTNRFIAEEKEITDNNNIVKNERIVRSERIVRNAVLERNERIEMNGKCEEMVPLKGSKTEYSTKSATKSGSQV